MDVHAIDWGDHWPERISSQLRRATTVMVIMGRNWLTAADQYGRRLLDDPADWVRREIAEALRRRATVMPVLLNDCRMPPAEALPNQLRGLSARQAVALRTGDAWDDDLKSIGDKLHRMGVAEREGGQRLPETPRKRALSGFTETQLIAALDQPELRSWEPWEEVLPSEYPAKRQELRRVFDFGSFAEAIGFMAFLAPRFDQENHHPRWANEWQRVAIRLSTWAAGNRITKEDIRVARKVEQWFLDFKACEENLSDTSDGDVRHIESATGAARHGQTTHQRTRGGPVRQTPAGLTRSGRQTAGRKALRRPRQ